MTNKLRFIILTCLIGVIAVVFAVKNKKQPTTEPSVQDRAVHTAAEPVSAAAEQMESPVPEEKIPTLIDLGANKCIPCKMMAPILEELTETHSDFFRVIFYDVWENREYAQSYGIRSIPTQVFLDPDGKELYRHEGFFSKEEILKTWQRLGYPTGETTAE